MPYPLNALISCVKNNYYDQNSCTSFFHFTKLKIKPYFQGCLQSVSVFLELWSERGARVFFDDFLH